MWVKIHFTSSGYSKHNMFSIPNCHLTLLIWKEFAFQNNQKILAEVSEGISPFQSFTSMIQSNYTQIGQEMENLVAAEMERMGGWRWLIVLKKNSSAFVVYRSSKNESPVFLKNTNDFTGNGNSCFLKYVNGISSAHNTKDLIA